MNLLRRLLYFVQIIPIHVSSFYWKWIQHCLWLGIFPLMIISFYHLVLIKPFLPYAVSEDRILSLTSRAHCSLWQIILYFQFHKVSPLAPSWVVQKFIQYISLKSSRMGIVHLLQVPLLNIFNYTITIFLLSAHLISTDCWCLLSLCVSCTLHPVPNFYHL